MRRNELATEILKALRTQYLPPMLQAWLRETCVLIDWFRGFSFRFQCNDFAELNNVQSLSPPQHLHGLS